MSKSIQLTPIIHQGVDIIAVRTFREQIRFVKSTGLSMAQFGILMQLHYQHGCGISDISTRMHITSAATSQLVDKLVQGGLLERTEDPVDRRVKQLKLSEKGQKMIAASLAARHRLVDTLIEALSPVEYKKVGAAMEIITKVFQQMQAKESRPE